jgi:hypothetical protein
MNASRALSRSSICRFQGAIVDQWFGGTGRQTGPRMNQDSPYFGYITNNILLGVS